MTLAFEPRSGTAVHVDAQRWPAIATLPTGRLRARVAKGLFLRVLRRLPVHVVLPDGAVLGAGGLTAPVMRLHRPAAFYRRVGASGLVGFGESYMAGDWEADDLTGVLTVFAREMSSLVPPSLQRLRGAATLPHPSADRQTRANQKRNIARHYDLSNELFEAFLDPSMSYSSALFEGRPPTWDGLPAAQHRKIDRLLDAVGVTAGCRLLEIGTGWGELALRAAERGATVLSVTLSEEQRKLALRRAEDAGVADQVRVEICDYRDVTGTFDAIVSVEMIEAVGYDYWPAFFRVLDARLRPGGRVGLQAITMPHDRMLASRATFTWVHKYIFPGGLIPSVTAIGQGVAAHTTLEVSDQLAFSADYAETLRLWRQRFEADPDAVQGLGFDAVFCRMWSLYLAYSEAGFRSGYLDVHQFVLRKATA
jgi:cyclopropane-fatty-acyl-phospholipid synthase